VIDIVHVLEYIWKAAWSLHPPGDPAAEDPAQRRASTHSVPDPHSKRAAPIDLGPKSARSPAAMRVNVVAQTAGSRAELGSPSCRRGP
jgi:hypothetical protein